MKCFGCGFENFTCREIKHFPAIKNELQEVSIATHVCNQCGAYLLDDEQMNNLRRKSADHYRIGHKLLTSTEIIKLRELFNLSQRAFAEYLNVGEASIKRWETYYVQDSSQDDHIRIKCDPFYAEKNLLLVKQAHSTPDFFNGLKKFSFNLFKQMILFFLKNMKCENKQVPILCFYADFFNFKNNNKSISGIRYLPFKTGPFPEKFRMIFDILKKENAIKKSENYYSPGAEFDATAFNKSEMESLNTICNFNKKSKNSITELVLREKAYIYAQDHDFLDYSYAKYLGVR